MSETVKKNRLSVLVPDWDVPSHVLACTTMRQSVDPVNAFSEFNLATHVGDDPSNVQSNRDTLKQALALPSEPQWLTQVHSTQSIELQAGINLNSPPEADAVFSVNDDVVCVVLTADCLPILLTDKQGRGVAAIHAGWRGLVNGIVSSTIEKFCERLNIEPDECVVWLGPAISQENFEVGEDVYAKFCSKYESAKAAFNDCDSSKDEKKYLCDLYHLARLELKSLGVSNISGGDRCTYKEEEYFYSHRRFTHQRSVENLENKNTGRLASLIWLSSNNRI